MPPFDQNWSSLSQALHTALSIGIWQRSAFHRRKWQQINKMDKQDVILSDQAACRYDENNRYSLLYSSCHRQPPIIFTKIGFQNRIVSKLCHSFSQAQQIPMKREHRRCGEFTRRPNTNDRCCRDGGWPPTGWLQLLGALLPAFTWNMSKGKCVEEYKHNTKEIQTEIQEKYSRKC